MDLRLAHTSDLPQLKAMYGKIIAGKVTPDFTAFLLGLPKPTDTEVYNKMTPFFTIALDNGFWSAHYGTELSKE